MMHKARTIISVKGLPPAVLRVRTVNPDVLLPADQWVHYHRTVNKVTITLADRPAK